MNKIEKHLKKVDKNLANLTKKIVQIQAVRDKRAREVDGLTSVLEKLMAFRESAEKMALGLKERYAPIAKPEFPLLPFEEQVQVLMDAIENNIELLKEKIK